MIKYKDIAKDNNGRLYVITIVADIDDFWYVIDSVVPVHISDIYELAKDIIISEDNNGYSLDKVFSIIGVVTDNNGIPIMIRTTMGTYVLCITGTNYNDSELIKLFMDTPINGLDDIEKHYIDNHTFIDKVNKIVKEAVYNGT